MVKSERYKKTEHFLVRGKSCPILSADSEKSQSICPWLVPLCFIYLVVFSLSPFHLSISPSLSSLFIIAPMSTLNWPHNNNLTFNEVSKLFAPKSNINNRKNCYSVRESINSNLFTSKTTFSFLSIFSLFLYLYLSLSHPLPLSHPLSLSRSPLSLSLSYSCVTNFKKTER